MSQPIPDISRARKLSKQLLETPLDQVLNPDQITLLEGLGMITPTRLSVPPEKLEAYFGDTYEYKMAYHKKGGESLMNVSRIDMHHMPLRDALADFWCKAYHVDLGTLEQIREAAQKQPAKIAEITTPTERKEGKAGRAKRILDLLLAIDALDKEGTPPQPNTIREGIKAARSLQSEFRESDVYYTKRRDKAEELERGHYESRALSMILAVSMGNKEAFPEYVPQGLKDDIIAYATSESTEGGTGRNLRKRLAAVIEEHDPQMTPHDFALGADGLKKDAQTQDARANLLMHFLGKLEEINTALAIPPSRPRSPD